jgi:hypothetical protein
MKITTSICALRVQGMPQVSREIDGCANNEIEIKIFENSASNDMRFFEAWYINCMFLASSSFMAFGCTVKHDSEF